MHFPALPCGAPDEDTHELRRPGANASLLLGWIFRLWGQQQPRMHNCVLLSISSVGRPRSLVNSERLCTSRLPCCWWALYSRCKMGMSETGKGGWCWETTVGNQPWNIQIGILIELFGTLRGPSLERPRSILGLSTP